jgi:hypothetical protein
MPTNNASPQPPAPLPTTALGRTIVHGVVAVTILLGLVGCGASEGPPEPRTSGNVTAPASSGGDGHAVPSAPGVPPSDLSTTGARGRSAGRADGEVPEGTTVFDDQYPGVAKLEAGLLTALRSAAGAARKHGVRFEVNSGWRSAAYQKRLFEAAVVTYGSRAQAARWVATAQTSPHVSGDAVDLGTGAAAWVAQHGAAFGLCRIYRNEPWHVELRPEAIARGCPREYADPTADPRMHR